MRPEQSTGHYGIVMLFHTYVPSGRDFCKYIPANDTIKLIGYYELLEVGKERKANWSNWITASRSPTNFMTGRFMARIAIIP